MVSHDKDEKHHGGDGYERLEAGGHDVLLVVHPGRGELVLDDHDDDPEHPHHQGVVADLLPLLEEDFPPAKSV